MPLTPETLALFVRFVRQNPTIGHDSEVMLRAFRAYVALDEAEELRARGFGHLAGLHERHHRFDGTRSDRGENDA